MTDAPYDAVLLVSFGGPEKREDVIPFLENVLRGRNVPRERMLEVAEHYYHFGGRSPINDQNRALIAALQVELKRSGIDLPIYWGNRNWHPLLPETIRQMRADGITRALAFVTSAFSSYSGCRQYLEDIARARQEVGEGAPVIEKLRGFSNHPDFLRTMVERTRDAFEQIPETRRSQAALFFTAHSIPISMASTSRYVSELEEASRHIAEEIGHAGKLVYQSRSGPPSHPWLEPDIGDALREAHAAGVRDVVVVPLGFLSDHMEVVYDLDEEARTLAGSLGINMVRAGTAGTHPFFISMIRELIEEKALALCESTCCPAPVRLAAR